MSGKRYCSHCGNGVPEGAKFCRCCGNPIPVENNIAAGEKEKAEDKTHAALWIIICMTVCLVVIFSALFVRGRSIDQQANEQIGNEKIVFKSGEDQEDELFEETESEEALNTSDVSEDESQNSKKNNFFTCPDCSGTGYVSVYSANAQVCGLCGGSGMYYNPSVYYDITLNMWMGEFMACAGCGGSGYVPGYISVECSRCGGTGKSL